MQDLETGSGALGGSGDHSWTAHHVRWSQDWTDHPEWGVRYHYTSFIGNGRADLSDQHGRIQTLKWAVRAMINNERLREYNLVVITRHESPFADRPTDDEFDHQLAEACAIVIDRIFS